MLTTQYQAIGTDFPLFSLLGYQTKEQLQKMAEDRRVIWRMERILHMHRSKEWKKGKVYQLLKDFADEKLGRKRLGVTSSSMSAGQRV